MHLSLTVFFVHNSSVCYCMLWQVGVSVSYLLRLLVLAVVNQAQLFVVHIHTGLFKRQCKKFRMTKDHEAVVLTAHQIDVDIWINGDYSIPYSAQQVTCFCSQRTAASLPRRALVVLASCVCVYVVREGRGYVTLPFP